jgi:hypothetical protein
LAGPLVFVSGYALKKNSLSLFTNNPSRPRADFKFDTTRTNYSYIFLLGVGVGIPTTLMFNYFPDLLEKSLSAVVTMDGKWLLVIALFFSAVLSLPASNYVIKTGTAKSFWWSLVVTSVSVVLVFISGSALLTILVMVVFTVSFTLLSISSLPLAIERANYFEKVFCVGIFFSGMAFPDGIVEVIQAI